MSGGDLVVGVDVGSQGACLSAFAADGERAATTYQPYNVSYPRPGWAPGGTSWGFTGAGAGQSTVRRMARMRSP